MGSFKYLVRLLERSENDKKKSPAKYQEGKTGVGAAWEDTLEGGSVSDSLREVLPCVSSGGTLAWRGGMVAHGYNESEVRGSACEFLDTGHT